MGNARVSFATAKDTAVVIQQDDYMPFGMEINQGISANPKNEYLYNKKELQEETGLYDYGARFYDPVIARWTSIDPLAEISRRWTPYNYVENDPVKLTDPDGMEATWDAYGNVTYTGEDAVNFAKGIQAYVSKTVSKALTFAGNMGGVGQPDKSGSKPPKDGDKNQKGQIYSEVLKNWVSKQVYVKIQYESMINKDDYDNQKKGSDAAIQLGINLGKSAIGTFLFVTDLEFLSWVIDDGPSTVLPPNASWKLGSGKSAAKWASQLLKRGWTPQQITNAIIDGESFPATNNINPANSATRYVNPQTGQSVVIDDITHEVIHIGGPGFKY